MIDYMVVKEFRETIYISIILLSCFIVYVISKSFLIPMIRKIINRSNNEISQVFFEQNVFHYLVYLTPIPIIDTGANLFPLYQPIIEKIIGVYSILIVIFIINKILASVLIIYNNKYGELSKKRPIKSFIQAGYFFVYTIGILFIFSQIFNRSIVTFLSSLGALTAILIIIFKDSILSFKAGIQLMYNDMLRIGDTVEIPKYNADGSVEEIALDTIKIKNWDNTVTFIPTYKLMDEPFINWRGMLESGARRIYRSIIIDQHSIRFLNSDDIEKYKRIHLISEYISFKKNEVDEYNQRNGIDTSEKINGKNLTNVGTFRIYVLNYLKKHKDINKELNIVVRQQSPTPEGFPIQIYCFTDQIELEKYEEIQSDIFDHILAIVQEFGLKIYQRY